MLHFFGRLWSTGFMGITCFMGISCFVGVSGCSGSTGFLGSRGFLGISGSSYLSLFSASFFFSSSSFTLSILSLCIFVRSAPLISFRLFSLISSALLAYSSLPVSSYSFSSLFATWQIIQMPIYICNLRMNQFALPHQQY